MRLFRRDKATSPAAAQPKRVRTRRIAVLGLDGIDVQTSDHHVRSFPWGYAGAASVGDYDVVLVNLSDAGPQDRMVGTGLPKDVDGNAVLDLLDGARRLITAGGEAVVIGRPDAYVWASGRGLAGRAYHWTGSVFTGMNLEWDETAGDQIEGIADAHDFAPYLRRLSGYRYALRVARPCASPARMDDFYSLQQAMPARALGVETTPLAWTRHRSLVASEHRLVERSPDGETRSGRVIILPLAPMPAREAVELLLREVYGVPIANEDAPWLEHHAAPGEAALDSAIGALRRDAAQIETAIQKLEQERQAQRRILRLLSTGGTALEEAVRDALRLLGAEVTDPIEPNKEDGWIVVRLPEGIREGVLEIKGTQKNTFDESGLKQLAQWKERGARAGRQLKGIFIGNSAYGLAPAQRPDPFGDGFRKTAASSDVVALTTAALLEELTRVREDVPPADFWRSVFATKGVYE